VGYFLHLHGEINTLLRYAGTFLPDYTAPYRFKAALFIFSEGANFKSHLELCFQVKQRRVFARESTIFRNMTPSSSVEIKQRCVRKWSPISGTNRKTRKQPVEHTQKAECALPHGHPCSSLKSSITFALLHCYGNKGAPSSINNMSLLESH
jgi:hypothetical protein